MRPRRSRDRAWHHPLERVWCISIRSWLLLRSWQLRIRRLRVRRTPGTRSRRSPCRRLSTRVRSATRSSRLSESRRSASDAASGSTAASLSLREAARAVARASSPSFFLALPVESTLTRAESLGGTSTTDSPVAASLTARCRPSPPSVLHRLGDARGTA